MGSDIKCHGLLLSFLRDMRLKPLSSLSGRVTELKSSPMYN